MKPDDDYSEYRRRKMESAKEFEDFVAWALLFYRGMVTVPYLSKRWQYRVGESTGGVEIKHDEKANTSKNLWIEMYEKAHPSRAEYTPSGILRADSSWLYVIGNYERLYIFAKAALRRMATHYGERENTTKTSKGFLLPVADAERVAGTVVVIKQEDRPDKED